MKTPLASSHSNRVTKKRPSLVCRAMRLAHSWQGDDATPRGRVGRHADGCAACADYFSQVQGWEQALQAERSSATSTAIPSGLEDRIWAAVRPEVEARREPVKPKWRADWRPFAGAAIAAALVLAVWLGGDPQDGDEASPGGVVAAADRLEFNEADMRELVATVEQFSTDLLTTSARESENAGQASVLEQEIQALGSDARGALRFLERNFLPRALQQRHEQI